MDMLGYISCTADPDLWIRKATKDEETYYHEYLLLYTGDCLAVEQEPTAALHEIDKYFPLKSTSVVPPKIYLGAKITRVQLPNGVEAYL